MLKLFWPLFFLELGEGYVNSRGDEGRLFVYEMGVEFRRLICYDHQSVNIATSLTGDSYIWMHDAYRRHITATVCIL